METRNADGQALASRLAKLSQDGVVDVKFCLRNPTEATVVDTCKEVEEMLQALEDGDTELVEPAKPKASLAS